MTQDIYGLGDYNTNQIKELVKLLEEEKMDPTLIYWRRPDAAPEPGASIKDIPLEEIAYIVPDAFAGELGVELASNFSLPQLQQIGVDGDPFLKQTIKLRLETALKQKPADPDIKDLNDYAHQSPAWQF